jgi:hypothetical protein
MKIFRVYVMSQELESSPVKDGLVSPAYVMMEHLEIFMAQPLLNIPLPAREVVVHHKHLKNVGNK